MKKIVIILVVVFVASLSFATNQQPDYLEYKGEEYSLSTGWGHPSPLETYYSQNNIEYPFEMLHTANYRGHVAKWEILEGKLFLNQILIDGKKYKPADFEVKSINDSVSVKNKQVFADWFSGVLECRLIDDDTWEVEKTYYFYVKKGVVVESQEITESDYDKIRNISESDTTDLELMSKYSMLVLNDNYISYYYRLHGNDTILFNAKEGYLRTISGLSPIMAFYNNDHLIWPYNWENFEKNGAPYCSWNVKEDSLMLTSLELHTGTGFYSIDRYIIDLNDFFPDKADKNQVFGDWITGAFIIRYGKEVEHETISDYFIFEVSEYTCIRVINGMVTEEYTLPADFDFEKIPKDAEEGLKSIIREFYE